MTTNPITAEEAKAKVLEKFPNAYCTFDDAYNMWIVENFFWIFGNGTTIDEAWLSAYERM